MIEMTEITKNDSNDSNNKIKRNDKKKDLINF